MFAISRAMFGKNFPGAFFIFLFSVLHCGLCDKLANGEHILESFSSPNRPFGSADPVLSSSYLFDQILNPISSLAHSKLSFGANFGLNGIRDLTTTANSKKLPGENDLEESGIAERRRLLSKSSGRMVETAPMYSSIYTGNDQTDYRIQDINYSLLQNGIQKRSVEVDGYSRISRPSRLNSFRYVHSDAGIGRHLYSAETQQQKKRAVEITLTLGHRSHFLDRNDRHSPESFEGSTSSRFVDERRSVQRNASLSMTKGHQMKRHPSPDPEFAETGLTLSITSPLDVLREKIRIDNERRRSNKHQNRKSKNTSRYLKDLGR